MKFYSIIKNPAAIIFAFSLFCMMPLLWSDHLLDNDMALRFIAISAVIFFASLYFLFVGERESMDQLRSKITYAWLAYLSVSAFACLYSINKGEAIYEFMKQLLFIFLFLYTGIFLSRQSTNKRTIIFFILIAAIIFSFIALLRLIPLFVDYFKTGKPILINYAIASSLSNKNFFAETILLCFPFSLYGIMFFRKMPRIIAAISLLLILFFILILQTVAVWLGLIAVVIISGMIIFYYRKDLKIDSLFNRFSKSSRILFSLLMLTALTVSVFIYSKTGNARLLKDRIKTGVNYFADSPAEENTMVNSNSTYERMILWRNSWRMIKDYPVIGVGFNNWKIYFPKYGISGAPFMNAGTVRFEYPHNDLLYIWCEKGIIGIVLYLLILLSALYTAMRKISSLEKTEEKWMALFLFSGTCAFIVISFFGFPNERIFSMVLFSVMLAFISFDDKITNEQAVKSKSMISYKWIFITGAMVAGFSFYSGIKRLNSEKHLVNAMLAQKQKNWGKMIRETANAENYFFPMDYTSTPIAWYNGFANFYAGNSEKACRKFKEAEKINPFHVHVLNDLGTCSNMKGDVITAINYYEKALNISPLFPDVLLNRSVIYYNEGNIDSAFATISKYQFKKTKDYLKNLQAILLAKAEKTISALADTISQSRLRERIKDEKWLISKFEQSGGKADKFEKSIIQNSDIK